MDFHVAGEVIVGMIVGYPQMRLYNWKLDLDNHALEVRDTKYSFLTYDDFARLSLTRGIRAIDTVPACARVSLEIPPNEVAFVPVAMPSDCPGSIVFLEPDPGYIERYQAYPCPGLLDANAPTAIRLI